MTRTAVLVAALLLLPLANAATLPTWSLVRTPNVGPEDLHTLRAATCIAPDDCWAVGYWSTCTSVSTPLPLPVNGVGVCNIHKTLILHWDGAEWTKIDSPDPAVKANQLHGVTCLASDDCWAVGMRSDPPIGSQPLLLHWDGALWTLVAGALPEGTLHGVSCASADECWAVGNGPDHLTDAGIIAMRWDGALWTAEWSLLNVTKQIVPDPSYNDLADVTCLPDGTCWAVGHVHHRSDSSRDTIAARWNGEAWTIVPTPSPHASRNVLHDVACASADDCWAVGATGSGTSVASILLRWNGDAWTLADFGTFPAESELESVTCIASDDCWAVGSGRTVPLLHWDGAAWTIVPAPHAGNAVAMNGYHGLACADAARCVAVGEYGGRTLAMGT